MRKHNIGRISIVIIALNVIFLLVYMADRNDTKPQTVQTKQETVTEQTTIYADETVDGSYVTTFENIISDHAYSKEEIAIIKSYEFYLTDIITNTDGVKITGNEVMIYAADDQFASYVNKSLNYILKEREDQNYDEQRDIKSVNNQRK